LQHCDNVEDLFSEFTIETPDLEILSSTFRKRLLALEGEDIQAEQRDAGTE
jgi:hypothetical protein